GGDAQDRLPAAEREEVVERDDRRAAARAADARPDVDEERRAHAVRLELARERAAGLPRADDDRRAGPGERPAREVARARAHERRAAVARVGAREPAFALAQAEQHARNLHEPLARLEQAEPEIPVLRPVRVAIAADARDRVGAQEDRGVRDGALDEAD